MPEEGHRDADLLLLGQAIRRMRNERGMSAQELAGAARVSERQLELLESGRLDPTYERLLVLAEALGVQPSALVGLAERLRE